MRIIDIGTVAYKPHIKEWFRDLQSYCIILITRNGRKTSLSREIIFIWKEKYLKQKKLSGWCSRTVQGLIYSSERGVRRKVVVYKNFGRTGRRRKYRESHQTNHSHLEKTWSGQKHIISSKIKLIKSNYFGILSTHKGRWVVRWEHRGKRIRVIGEFMRETRRAMWLVMRILVVNC